MHFASAWWHRCASLPRKIATSFGNSHLKCLRFGASHPRSHEFDTPGTVWSLQDIAQATCDICKPCCSFPSRMCSMHDGNEQQGLHSSHTKQICVQEHLQKRTSDWWGFMRDWNKEQGLHVSRIVRGSSSSWFPNNVVGIFVRIIKSKRSSILLMLKSNQINRFCDLQDVEQ